MPSITKTCPHCEKSFEVDEEDQAYYAKIQVPPPTHCPFCRHLRRLSMRNERFLYPNTCALCEKNVIAVFTKDTAFTVYCNDCWWGDSWSPTDYAAEYDPSKPFFQQYQEFTARIPRFALYQDGSSENCEYVNYGVSNKNCYLAIGAYGEDCYYCHGMIKAKSCMDCFKVLGCELMYQCIDCENCYNLIFAKDCTGCSDSSFIEDCRNCQNCFLSAGLRNKQYVFQNQQLTKEQYESQMRQIKYTPETIKEFLQMRKQLNLEVPKKFMHGTGSENVTGDYIDNAKNVKNCFDTMGAENCAYCYFIGMGCHNTYDGTMAGLNSELCYEVNGTQAFFNCKFVYYGRQLSDCEYCQQCYNSQNLFGCFGLNHKKYCIFNKQYSSEDYEKLKGKIVQDMRTNHEYGEFFPFHLSDFPYNESVAHEYAPLTKEQAHSKNLRFREQAQTPQAATGQAKNCTTCHRSFKIIAQEQKVYDRYSLPQPNTCPECRHRERFNTRPPQILHQRDCYSCHKSLRTTYAPARPEKIYCEECYQQEMN